MTLRFAVAFVLALVCAVTLCPGVRAQGALSDSAPALCGNAECAPSFGTDDATKLTLAKLDAERSEVLELHARQSLVAPRTLIAVGFGGAFVSLALLRLSNPIIDVHERNQVLTVAGIGAGGLAVGIAGSIWLHHARETRRSYGARLRALGQERTIALMKAEVAAKQRSGTDASEAEAQLLAYEAAARELSRVEQQPRPRLALPLVLSIGAGLAGASMLFLSFLGSIQEYPDEARDRRVALGGGLFLAAGGASLVWAILNFERASALSRREGRLRRKLHDLRPVPLVSRETAGLMLHASF